MSTITISLDEYEHLLNCLCNQKFIHEQKPEVQEEWQGIFDKAWMQGMDRLTQAKNAQR